MRLAGLVASALVILLLVVAIGVAASIRYGIAGRRVSAGLVVLLAVALNTPRIGERSPGWQAAAITTLRAINAAQLLYSTSIGAGRYADSLDELTRAGLFMPRGALRFHYDLRLIKGGESYAATAVPVANARDKKSDPVESFCVDAQGSIFRTPGRIGPEVANGRCRDRSKPIR